MKNKMMVVVFVSGAFGMINAMDPDVPVTIPVDLEKEFPSYAGTIPPTLKTEIAAFVTKHGGSLGKILGAKEYKKPFVEVREDNARAQEALTDMNAVVLDGKSNYVFSVPELPEHIIRAVRRPITIAEAAEMVGLQGDLNGVRTTEDYLKLCAKLDGFKVDPAKPQVDPTRTHHILSLLLGARRIEQQKQKGEFGEFDRVLVPGIYGILLDPGAPACDRNCFLVQQFVGGFSLKTFVSYKHILGYQHLLQQKYLLRQLYRLVAKGLVWNPRIQHLIVEDPSKFPGRSRIGLINLQKRDRYLPRVKTFSDDGAHRDEFSILAHEANHLRLCGLEELADVLKGCPELFDVIQDELGYDEETKNLLKTAKHIAVKYPCLQEAASRSSSSSSKS